MDKPKPRLRLKINTETEEWMVVWLDWTPKGWIRNEGKTYYTDDRADALATMAFEQDRINAGIEY